LDAEGDKIVLAGDEDYKELIKGMNKKDCKKLFVVPKDLSLS